ncbi:MAG: histidine kinase [Verrucomicrobia bacterium]|nr:histidine kinase [Verrucomicrobiota bacterium]
MRPGCVLFLLLCAGLPGAARLRAAGEEIGRPLVRHYTPGEYLRHLDCQLVTQDATGTMIFANVVDLLAFDGARWTPIFLPTDSAGIRQLTQTADGTIYVAGAGAIGRLQGRGAEARYVSLAPLLPPEAANIDELRAAVACGRTVWFASDDHLLRWRDGAFTAIPYPTPPGSHGARLHRVGDEVYVTALGHPLGRLREADATVDPVADDPVVRDNKIILLEAGAGGSLVLLTAERGFFVRRPGSRIVPMDTPMNRWLRGKRVFCAARLPDGSHVAGFSAVSGDGGVRFAPDGRYLGPIDTSLGLWVKQVRDFFPDREGGLWLGTDTGVARLEWPSPLSLFDATNGLGQGAVAAAGREGGMLHIATGEGLFRLVPQDDAGRMAHAERLAGREFFALAEHPAGLLALSDGQLSVVRAGRVAPVLALPLGGGALRRSAVRPDRVWVGTTQGIRAVRATDGMWQEEGEVPRFHEAVEALAEAADGTLWVATPERVLYRLSFTDAGLAPARVERFARGKGWPEALGNLRLVQLAGDVVFLADGDGAVRRYRPQSRTFEAAASDPVSPEPAGEVEQAAPGADGALWVARGATLCRIGPGARELPHFVKTAVGRVSWLREEDGGQVLWVGGEKGLARVDLTKAFPPPAPFAVQLRAQGVTEGARLPPEPGPVAFSFVAPRQRPTSAVAYQSRLDGWERGWTEWSSRRERSFANLRSGRYRFEVRARDAEGVVATPAELSFDVLAPWWLTGWAIAAYILAGAGSVAGIVWLRTRTLHRRAEYLEGVVAERTAELARQNAELVRLNQLELDEKISARLAEEKARLEVLRYQLNPHFLFNTLASISASLPAGPTTARTMVERLAEFCRMTLHRADERDWTTLGGELQLLRAYLDIERSRWGELLDVEIAIADGVEQERLPHFLLLPLVENALKYGRATSPDRVGVKLTATRAADGALVLAVANTGEWIEPQEKKQVSSLGIGLDNLRERLARHYPRAHTLEITHGRGWVTVTLRIWAPSAL